MRTAVLLLAYGQRQEGRRMTEQQAAAYIARLTYEEKLELSEMLRSLAQKRPLSPSPLATTEPDA